jgi:hypothetical protein
MRVYNFVLVRKFPVMNHKDGNKDQSGQSA